MNGRRFGIILICVVILSGLGFSQPSKPKFPVSTTLCGLKTRDNLVSVKKLYGEGKVIWTNNATPTMALVFNDPKTNARLVVDTGEQKMNANSSVCGITLEQGKDKKVCLSSKPFAKLGDFYGIGLGATRHDIERYYGKQRWHTEKGLEIVVISVASPEDWPCEIAFSLKNKRVAKIFSGYLP